MIIAAAFATFTLLQARAARKLHTSHCRHALSNERGMRVLGSFMLARIPASMIRYSSRYTKYGESISLQCRSSPCVCSDGASPRYAVLVDADNTHISDMQLVMKELSRHGSSSSGCVYGDFTGVDVDTWKQAASDLSFRLMNTFSFAKRTGTSDQAMTIDAMDLLHTDEELDGFALVSSGHDFSWLAHRLRGAGKTVLGFGMKTAPGPFVEACEQFISVENLRAEAKSLAGRFVPFKPSAQGEALSAQRAYDKPQELQDLEMLSGGAVPNGFVPFRSMQRQNPNQGFKEMPPRGPIPNGYVPSRPVRRQNQRQGNASDQSLHQSSPFLRTPAPPSRVQGQRPQKPEMLSGGPVPNGFVPFQSTRPQPPENSPYENMEMGAPAGRFVPVRPGMSFQGQAPQKLDTLPKGPVRLGMSFQGEAPQEFDTLPKGPVRPDFIPYQGQQPEELQEMDMFPRGPVRLEMPLQNQEMREPPRGPLRPGFAPSQSGESQALPRGPFRPGITPSDLAPRQNHPQGNASEQEVSPGLQQSIGEAYEFQASASELQEQGPQSPEMLSGGSAPNNFVPFQSTRSRHRVQQSRPSSTSSAAHSADGEIQRHGASEEDWRTRYMSLQPNGAMPFQSRPTGGSRHQAFISSSSAGGRERAMASNSSLSLKIGSAPSPAQGNRSSMEVRNT